MVSLIDRGIVLSLLVRLTTSNGKSYAGKVNGMGALRSVEKVRILGKIPNHTYGH